MWSWINEHTQFLNLVVNVGMLVVWITYLQLLLNNYRRQREPAILITRGAGRGIRSRCLITNMSQEPVYVTSLIATLITDDGSADVALTDMHDDLPDDLGTDPRSAMRQGSLQTGQYLDIGHFEDVIIQLVETTNLIQDPQLVREIDLTVVALYGSDRVPVGAKRLFSIDRSDPQHPKITPLTVSTNQHTSRRQRRELLETLHKYM